ncbi:MAG: sigma 54-interacting transcriptional regulator [Acidobacteria bacterium]|nr:sigma 54-interacting transcriptional regulator [Acidobacteriota bacterium]
MKRTTVGLGLLGPSLDRGLDARRWEAWRPTVSLFQHEDLLIQRFELLHDLKHKRLAETVAGDIAAVSPETQVNRHLVELSDPWDFEEVYGVLHDFARGYPFEPDREDYLVHITTGTHVAQICLFLLTEARHVPGRLVQTSPPKGRSGPGAFQIIDLDLERYGRLASRFAKERRDDVSYLKDGIATRNAAFNRLVERLERVAVASRAPVLLLGPTGAGKSRLARRLWELKKAKRQVQGPFVDVNCATLRGDGAMSALFGHERGAYTGAAEKRPGLLRAADGGVLFLDEIGELAPDEQAMLLRALEEKRFRPLGGDREVSSDFQLVAGTNKDLSTEVRAGRFRDDLLARINLWTFRLPPLRERPEDIAPNLDFELEEHTRRTGTRVRLSREAREKFLAFATSPGTLWLGNFRDLNAAVTRMATLAPGGVIGTDDVAEEVARLELDWHAGEAGAKGEELPDVLAGRELDPFDAVQLREVIRVCRGSRSLSEAGRRLFPVSRAGKENPNDADRLRKYLARFDLTFAEVRPTFRA